MPADAGGAGDPIATNFCGHSASARSRRRLAPNRKFFPTCGPPDLAGRVDFGRSISLLPDEDALVQQDAHPITDLYFHGTFAGALIATCAPSGLSGLAAPTPARRPAAARRTEPPIERMPG